jgi:hypothetical protein
MIYLQATIFMGLPNKAEFRRHKAISVLKLLKALGGESSLII